MELLIETSSRGGFVALVRTGAVVQCASLDERRRHARDLAEAVSRILTAEGLNSKAVERVIVSLGPGSYTGLRVGLASAKSYAFATGCHLIAVPTFHAIANRAAINPGRLHVLADALQGLLYIQAFVAAKGIWSPAGDLRIVPDMDSIGDISPTDSVTGPGVGVIDDRLPPDVKRMPLQLRTVSAVSLWQASRQFQPLLENEMFAAEPLYLRGSSAEEKRKAQSEPPSESSASCRES